MTAGERHPAYKGTLPAHVRNEQIVAAYVRGDTMQAIGTAFGITRERVRQILVAEGISTRTRVDSMQLAYERWVVEHGPRLDASFDELRVISRVAAAHPDLSEKWIRRYLDARMWETIPARRRGHRQYTDDDLLAVLRRLAVDGRITCLQYASERESTDPSQKTFLDRFGSWRAAVEAAGLTPGYTRRTYTRRWDDDDLVDALRSYVEVAVARQERPTCRGYEAFRFGERPEFPSLSLIRTRIKGPISAILSDY